MQLSESLIKYSGIIEFEPAHVTKKHETQGEWKRTAMVLLGDDLAEYYAWFLKKRFDLNLIKPLRKAHVSFINDRFNKIKVDITPELVLKTLKYVPHIIPPKPKSFFEVHNYLFRSRNELDLWNAEREVIWQKVKNKWDGKEIDIILNTNIFTNSSTHWWLNVDHAYRDELHGIRSELGLGRPFAGLHMTIGHANDLNRAHSEYIIRLHKLGIIKLNDY